MWKPSWGFHSGEIGACQLVCAYSQISPFKGVNSVSGHSNFESWCLFCGLHVALDQLTNEVTPYFTPMATMDSNFLSYGRTMCSKFRVHSSLKNLTQLRGSMWLTKNFTSSSYSFCTSTLILKLEMTIFCDSQLLTRWDDSQYDPTTIMHVCEIEKYDVWTLCSHFPPTLLTRCQYLSGIWHACN